MQSKQRWQDWVILTLGVWLFFSPFFMGYASLVGAAAWDSYAVGALAAIFAVSALWSTAPQVSPAEEWVNVVLGLWMVTAPFLLGFYASEATAAWNHIVLGVLIGGDAIWALAAKPATGTHVHHH